MLVEICYWLIERFDTGDPKNAKPCSKSKTLSSAEAPIFNVTPADAGTRAGRIPASAVVATVLGNALEFYDFTTYAFFAVMIGRVFFPTRDPLISLLLSVATFGVGFITRPLGGVVIGAY